MRSVGVHLVIGLGMVLVGGVVTSADAATVTDLRANARRGQTFITFAKNADASPDTTFDVYRSTTPIVLVNPAQKVATLDGESWHLRYDDRGQPTPHLSEGFIIEDGGAPLTSSQGLLVWTTEEDGCFFYAVTNSRDRALVSGVNTMTSCVRETHLELPGWVLLEPAFVPSGGVARTFKFFRWENYAKWRTDQWGYYGHRVNVFQPIGFDNVQPPYAVVLGLHAAGFGYVEPGERIGTIPRGIVISPRDNGIATRDPYTDTVYGHSLWFGRYDEDARVVVPITEQRIVDYVRLVLADPVFQADVTRVYVAGASLGGGAMHVAAHHPQLFAAAETSIGYVDTVAYSGGMAQPQPPNTAVSGHPERATWEQWEDMKWMADNGYPIPPILHTFNKDDGTVRADHYPDALRSFESAKLPYAAQWRNGNHVGFQMVNGAIGGAWDLYRFASDEAHPAFGSVSSSDAFEVQEGQRNVHLDWGSRWHPVGEPMEDSVTRFGISLRADTDVTADVTIRNAQQFLPAPGDTVGWTSTTDGSGQPLGNGTVTVDPGGLVTIRALRVPAAGVRLTLSCDTCRPRAVLSGSQGRAIPRR